MKKLIHAAALHPRIVLWGTLVLVLLFASQIARIQVDTDPENMLPHDQPDRLLHEEIKKRFSLHDMIVVGVVNERNEAGIYNPGTLNNIVALTGFIARLEGVIEKDLMSLSNVDNITQEGPGTIRFEWMMKTAPENDSDARLIQQSVERLPLFYNTLASETGQAAAIYVPIEKKDMSHRISVAIEEFVASLPGDDQYHITGLPVAEDTFGVEMFIQMAISAPLAALVIFGLMWFFFRSFSLVSAPMLVAMATVLITMGFLIGSGFTVHIMSSMIPIFLMPIAVVDSIHILSEFAELHKPGDDPKSTIEKVLNNLFKPMLFTSITSSVGFASLAFTPIPPVQIFGLYVAFGIFLAFLLTVTFIPAYVVSLSPKAIEKLASIHHDSDSNGVLSRLLPLTQGFSLRHAGKIIFVSVALVAVSTYGIMQIRINDNPVRWFKESHDIRVADRVLNENFAGTYSAFLVLEKAAPQAPDSAMFMAAKRLASEHDAEDQLPQVKKLISSINTNSSFFQSLSLAIDTYLFEASPANESFWYALLDKTETLSIDQKYFQKPEALDYIERLQAHLTDTPMVGKANGLPDVVKTVYRELTGGDTKNYRLPPSAKGVAESLLSYQSSHRPDDLWHFVTPDFRATAVWVQLRSGDNIDMESTLKATDEFIARNPLPEGVSLKWGGLTYINVIWQDAMVNGMLQSLLSAFVIVFVMMVFLFRSVFFGILAMIPLSLTIGFIYGLIGLVGKEYDMPVAVLSALTLGLSVDFAIHFLERLRTIYRETGDWQETITQMFGEPALAISRNAIVIAIGFLPLLAAPLVPYNTVGFFLAAIMFISAVTTLILLTALLKLMHGWALK